MNYFARYIIAISLAILSLSTTVVSAHYYGANFPKTAITHINKHGRENCKAISAGGYKLKLRGRLENQDSSGGPLYSEYRPFTVISCFKTKKQCQHFVSRIRNRIADIERIRYARCKSI